MSGVLSTQPRRRPTLAEFGAVAAVLVALFIVQTVARLGAEPILATGTDLLGHRLVATGVYSGLAVLGLGAGALAIAAYRGHDVRRYGWDELLATGTAVTILVVVGVYVAVGARRPALPTSAVVVPAVYYLGMALLAVGYARARGVALRTTGPRTDDIPTIGLGALVVAGVVAALTAVAVAFADAEVARLWGGIYGANRAPGVLFLSLVAPALLAAAGTALLFNGVIQESLRTRGSAAGAAGAVTVLAFLFDWTFASLFAVADLVVAVAAAVAAIGLLAAVAVAYWAAWPRVDETLTTLATAATVGVAGVVLAHAVLWTLVGTQSPLVLPTVAYAVALGVAAVVYDRTDSVWAPFAVLLTYELGIEVLAYGAFLATAG